RDRGAAVCGRRCGAGGGDPARWRDHSECPQAGDDRAWHPHPPDRAAGRARRRTGMNVQTLMNAAADLSALTGEVALRHYQRALEVEIKHDGSPVTAGDREAEATARPWLEPRFPDEGFSRRPAQRAAWVQLASVALVSRSWGDCYGYLLVATGRAEVMVDGILAVWDAAPVLPLIEEAGGVFTDWSGRRTAFGSS